MYILYTVYTNNRVQCRTHTHRKDHTQQLDLNNTCQVATPKKVSKSGCRTISCKQLSDSSCPEFFSARCEKKQFPEWQRKGCLDKKTCNGVSFENKGSWGCGQWALIQNKDLIEVKVPHQIVQIFSQKMLVNKRTCIHTISVYYKHTSTTTIHSPQISGKFK